MPDIHAINLHLQDRLEHQWRTEIEPAGLAFMRSELFSSFRKSPRRSCPRPVLPMR